jgi:hypothetical protein
VREFHQDDGGEEDREGSVVREEFEDSHCGVKRKT